MQHVNKVNACQKQSTLVDNGFTHQLQQYEPYAILSSHSKQCQHCQQTATEATVMQQCRDLLI